MTRENSHKLRVYGEILTSESVTTIDALPREVYPFCHLTAVTGSREHRDAGPSFVGSTRDPTGSSFRGKDGQSGFVACEQVISGVWEK